MMLWIIVHWNKRRKFQKCSKTLSHSFEDAVSPLREKDRYKHSRSPLMEIPATKNRSQFIFATRSSLPVMSGTHRLVYSLFSVSAFFLACTSLTWVMRFHCHFKKTARLGHVCLQSCRGVYATDEFALLQAVSGMHF